MATPTTVMPTLPLDRRFSPECSRPVGASIGALVELAKPRLAALSVLTTVAGYAAARPAWDTVAALALLTGTSLSAAGALALNQWRERATDALMERTRGRPLPSGRVSPGLALLWSSSLSVSGVLILALGTKPLAALISAATIVLYVFAYTPLKRRTRWATEVGAIPGALPPLIGFAAADGGFSTLAWLVFAVLLLWQMPHFFAIGWRCRDEYAAAGFPLLPVIDLDGRATANWSLGYTAALLVVSILPWSLGLTGALYGLSALAAGLGLLWRAAQFHRTTGDRDPSARRLFFATLIYLPVVLASLVVDRCWL
jgi:heme o synthase